MRIRSYRFTVTHGLPGDCDKVSEAHGEGDLGHVDHDCREDCLLTVSWGTSGCCEHEHMLVRVHSGP